MHVTKDMSVGEIVEKYPEAAEIMASHGLHCVGCHFNPLDTLEGGSLLHGIPQKEIEEMLEEINEAIAEKQKKHSNASLVTLTYKAAETLSSIMQSEGKSGYSLRVAAAESPCGCGAHSFYMEFEEKESDDDFVEQANGVRILVSKKISEKIRGTTIDFQESSGGFTMRNPNAGKACACGQSSSV